MTRPQQKRPSIGGRVRTRYPSITGSAVLTFALVGLAMFTSWTISLAAANSAGPFAGAGATVPVTPDDAATAEPPADRGTLDIAIPAVAIAEPLVITPSTELDTSSFNVSTSRSIAFDTLLASRRVHLVGDSLALSARDELTTIFGDRITIDAESGLGLYYAQHRIASAAEDPDIVVVALGTNDFNAPDAFNQTARAALETLAGASCVVWVDTQEFEPGLADINVGLLNLAEEFDMYVAGWSALAGPAELHAADGYHLSTAGQQLFADLIAATVETNCLRSGLPTS